VLDCVLDWRRAHPGEDVARVVVRGNPLLAVRTDRPDIATGREAQVSVQHAVAAALVTGQAGLAQFTDEWAREPAGMELRRKVEVMRDDTIATVAAQVELWTTDGAKHDLSTAAARGSPDNPMRDGDLEDKLRTVAADWRPGHDVSPLIDAVWNLEQSDDVARLLALTVPRS